MVRRSHVATEFICVATRNEHYISAKLVAIRHSVRDKGALPCTIEALCRPLQTCAYTIGMRPQLGCVNDRGASATKVPLSRQTWTVMKNKIKDPRDLVGHTSMAKPRADFVFLPSYFLVLSK